MYVIYASNNSYAKFLGISMLSLFENNQDLEEIIVYILAEKIDSKNIDFLYCIAKSYKRHIKFIDISEFDKRIPFDFNTGGYNSIVLSRLFLGSILPANIKCVLYLDCDTIISNSIRELENISFQGNLVAAVPELYMPTEKKVLLGLQKDEIYYNAGVLLINLLLWRTENIETRFEEYYRSMDGRLLYNDQDIINFCCRGRILTLSHTYNLSTNLFYFPRFYVKKLQPAYDASSADKYSQILSSPAIIHYMGDERPWIAGNYNKYRRQYEYYMKKSPWKNEPLVEGQRLYMLCYHLLNLITLICPWFRTLFSRMIGINRYKWFRKR